MEFKTKHVGGWGPVPAIIIELTVESMGSTITESVTDLKGHVSDDFILSLRSLADELENHNEENRNVKP